MPEPEPIRPWLSAVTYLGFQLNGWLENGNHGVTFEDVYEGLDNETLWQVINAKVPKMDLSMFDPAIGPTNQGPALIRALRDAADGMRGRERRKYGVESGGLSLLLAFVLEAVQQEYWVPNSESRYKLK
jgi:hypothetical protein